MTAFSPVQAQESTKKTKRRRFCPSSNALPLGLNTGLAALACLLLTGASLWWNLAALKEQTHFLAVKEARANFNKDMGFRLWATVHGGVYVPVSERTPPNPYLSHIPERDITTPSGKKLTLMNPAYMLRQLMEFHNELYGVKGRITSLKALNPGNAPDPWEKKALEAFERGTKEVVGYAEIDGAPYLRLIRPMFTLQACLKCHADQGYKVDDIRGAVAVSVPVSSLRDIAKQSQRKILLSHLLFGSLTLLIILALFIRGKSRLAERMQTEQSLLESEERFRNTFEQAAVGIAHLSPDQTWLRVNQKLCDILGYSREDLLKLGIAQIIHPDEQNAKQALLAQLLEGSIPAYTLESRAQTQSGEAVWINLTASLVRDANNTPIYFIVVVQDITEQKNLESQLHQSQKMEAMGTMAGGIAHDFNNILTPILGYTELLLMPREKEGRETEELKEILKAAVRAKELVKQILTFSRRNETIRQPMEISPVIKEALKLLRASMPASIEFRTAIDAHCGLVVANPTEIHQIVMNLCNNAAHAMRDSGGTLAVSLREVVLGPNDLRFKIELPPGSYLRLEVSDTGHGIQPADLERIFEPYFTNKAKGEGTGLGLSVVHGIVKHYHGAITVYSEPDHGSTFHVYLPKYLGKAVEESPAVSPGLAGGSERILVVDDEEQIVSLLTAILSSLGYQVSSSNASQEVLERFAADPQAFDLLITDQSMPKITGAELSKQILTIRPNLPIILCTGFSEVLNRDKALALGISDYLMKPVSAADLALSIRKALDNRKQG